MNELPTAKSKIVRSHKRASYKKKDLYAVLDAGYLCHVSYMFNGSPIIIPTAYGRENDTIFIHGALKNRMLNSIIDQDQACLAVTHEDGLVLARSAFHHSFNYRSAVVFGKPRKVENSDEKLRIMKIITENILPGRWSEVRQPNEAELAITMVVAIDVEEASVKMREGRPLDEEADYDLPVWAGVLPLRQVFGNPITDPAMRQEIAVPASVTAFVNK
jgi:nitroimidazol reductase NimA-like FMN-containing flavoprotein (pyridoxamine 5'-phosphate oxidase superfamily)